MNLLNASQVHILQALAKAPHGLTRAQLQAATGNGVSLSADNLGPVTDDPLDRGSNPESLRARGMVDVQTFEDEPPMFMITGKGLKWAQRSSAERRLPEEHKIPHHILDSAVIVVKKNKSYGLERFKPEDIEEVRAMCAYLELEKQQNSPNGYSNSDAQVVIDRYASIDDKSITDQMTNRRKQGAYADPNAKIRADLKKLGSLLRKFNVHIDEDSETMLDELCDNHDLPPIMQQDE